MKIRIFESNSVRSSVWAQNEITWNEILNKIKNPVICHIDYETYESLPKDDKAQYKDGDCFVGAVFRNSRRRKQDVVCRTLITLDIESDIENPNWDISDVYSVLDQLGFESVLYTTISHGPDNPRCRVIFNPSRGMSPGEYEPVARYLADKIGLEKVDQTTYDINRAMYWPKVTANGIYESYDIAGPKVDVDQILGEYNDFRNPSEWPRLEKETQKLEKLLYGNKQEDPTTKTGWIGDFCRAYKISEAINEFLPDVYDGFGNRYTYLLGSSAYGAEVFEDKWIYSHHSTDPISGLLCNAYDMVRIHLFGDDDDSYADMINLMTEDDKVREEHLKSEAKKFENVPQMSEEGDDEEEETEPVEVWNWEDELTVKRNKVGDVVSVDRTIPNFEAILENDPKLKGFIRMDNFTEKLSITGPVPWIAKKDCKIFEDKECCNTPKYNFLDKDFAALQSYISHTYRNLEDEKKLRAAITTVANKNAFNDVRNYFRNLPEWDGVVRLEKIFIDYLGADDTPYVRAVARKTLVALVARVMTNTPVKYDCMPVLHSSRQGIGKSTLLSKIGMMNYGWFTDSLTDFDNAKSIAEMTEGKILIEMGEMSFMSKADVSKVKQLLSSQSDRFRRAFSRYAEDRVRRCVFFATSNEEMILKDQGDNRRFLIIKCDKQKPTKSVFKDLTQEEVNKIWAEAYHIWKQGDEILYLTEDLIDEAKALQDEFRDVNPLEGVIETYLDLPVPKDWYEQPLKTMNSWYSDYFTVPELHNLNAWKCQKGLYKLDENSDFKDRDAVCIPEIWSLFLGNTLASLNGNRKASNDIVNVMRNMRGWKSVKRNFGPYGRCKGWVREE